MRKILMLSCVLLPLYLTGCATSTQKQTYEPTYYTLTQEEIDKSTPQKLPTNYKTLIKQYFTKVLKDPDTAKYIFYKPVRAYSASTKTVFLIVKVEVNGKNSYGGYTGYKPYFFSRDSKGGVMESSSLFSMTKIVIVDDFIQE